MPSSAQLAKAYGYLPDVALGDLATKAIDTTELEQFLENRFCAHPDAYDPEVANADPDTLARDLALPLDECNWLIESHLRYADARRGWPPNCHTEFPDSHAVSFFLDRTTFPEHYTRPVRDEELEQVLAAGVWRWTKEELFDTWRGKPMLDVAYLGLVRESYRLVGLAMLEKHDGPTGKHQMHIKSVFIPGSTIGVGWFPDGSCSDHVNQHIDNSYRPGLMGTAKLGCHECGHCVGLEHEFSNQNYHRGVMSYNPPSLFYGFSTGKSPHTLPRDPSLDKLIAMYSGKPNPPLIDEPGPIPVPTRLVLDPLQIEMFNGQPIIRNEFKVLGRDFIIVPKPRI